MRFATIPTARRRLVTLSLFAVAAASTVCAQSIVMDNVDGGFSMLTGSWTLGTSAPGRFGDSYRFANSTTDSSPSATAEWRPTISAAGVYEVSVWYPQGTNRANNSPFTVYHAFGSTTIPVNQQTNGGQWNVLGSFTFNAGTAGRVVLGNNANPSVVIADAVRFVPESTTVELTMAGSPVGVGSTTPAIGSPHTYFLNEIVPITATAPPGYFFHHWEADIGAQPAAPGVSSTTVQMDTNKIVTAVFTSDDPSQAEFRAFWADAFGSGFKSATQIDAMIAYALQGNYNAIIPEVLAYHDTGAGGHGAYWNSAIVPKAGDISPASFDPLAYLVQQAHAAGIEVHCWLVTYRLSTAWPPPGNSYLSARSHWLMTPLASRGSIAQVGGAYVFDPGSPDVQEYLVSIVRELVSNYQIDGIHWDYIRYTQTDAGYPRDLSYARSSLARWQQLTGSGSVPAATGNASWDSFRRQSVTELVRRAMFEIATIPNPRQPLRHTGALITFYPANTDFTQTSPYRLFSNWKDWQAKSYIDATIPMCYYDEQSYASTYRGWATNAITWANQAGRHTFIGPGIYLNSVDDSLTQIVYARNAGAHGVSTYSYRSTNDGSSPTFDWYSDVSSSVFVAPAQTPSMPWRDPATATQGTIYGRVTNGLTGAPIDNATIRLNGFSLEVTDGNGYFILSRHPAAAGDGSISAVSAVASGYGEVTRPRVRVTRAGWTEANIALGDWLSGDYDVDGDVDRSDFLKFVSSWTGPDIGPPPLGADLFDFESDNDIDLVNFATFQTSFGR